MSPNSPCYLLACSFRNCQRWATSKISGLSQFLAVCVVAGGLFALPAQAQEWSADFQSGLPDGWTAFGIPVPISEFFSPTFSATLESGILRLSDTKSAVDGGSFGGFGGVETSVFTDVSVSARVNVEQDSTGDLGVVARTNPGTGTAYFGNVDFELGQACIAKVDVTHNVAAGEQLGMDMACTAEGLLNTSASYFLQLDALGSSPTNLQLNVFDQQGGALLATVSATDDGTLPGFGGEYASGIAGVFAIPGGVFLQDALALQINGTFDNVSAVPEPAGSVLLLLGVAALLRWQPKSRN